MIVVGFDIDGVLARGLVIYIPGAHENHEHVVVSGRTWSEYDDTTKELAKHMPVYVRGAGQYGDRVGAGNFKAKMVEVLGINRFYEDDPLQAEAIMARNLDCDVVLVGPSDQVDP